MTDERLVQSNSPVVFVIVGSDRGLERRCRDEDVCLAQGVMAAYETVRRPLERHADASAHVCAYIRAASYIQAMHAHAEI